MVHRIVRTSSTVALGYALFILPALWADDAPAKSRSPAPKPIDWSAYRTIGDVVGEVVKADDKSVTIRVTWFETKVNGGARRGRPPLSRNPRNFTNPYGGNRGGRSGAPRVQVKEHHHDYELEFVPETLVRSKKRPQKFDDGGKRVDLSQKDIDQLLLPPGAPHYAASPYDLSPGTIVEVIIIRDRSIPAAKATEEDLRVKYVIILGKNPNTPKDNGNAKDNKKGKKAKN